MRHHPDRYSITWIPERDELTRKQYKERFKCISNAHETLADPSKRAAYDKIVGTSKGLFNAPFGDSKEKATKERRVGMPFTNGIALTEVTRPTVRYSSQEQFDKIIR